MCLAVPGKIIEIKDTKATADFGGIKKEIDISFLKDVKLDNWVLVHVGFAIQIIDESVAKNTYKLLENE